MLLHPLILLILLIPLILLHNRESGKIISDRSMIIYEINLVLGCWISGVSVHSPSSPPCPPQLIVNDVVLIRNMPAFTLGRNRIMVSL